MDQTTSDVGQQPPWSPQQQPPPQQQQQQQQKLQQHHHHHQPQQQQSHPTSYTSLLPNLQQPLPNMSTLSPLPAMSPLPSSPNGQATAYTNPPSPWFSAQHQYQQHMDARRNGQMDFRYGQQPPPPPPPGPGQQHHPGPLQPPPMNVAQQQHAQHPGAQQHPQQHIPQPPPPHAPSQQPPPPQQQQQGPPTVPAPAQSVSTPGGAPRSRKRPNPSGATPTMSASPIIPPPPVPTGNSVSAAAPAGQAPAAPAPGAPGAQVGAAPAAPGAPVKDEAGAAPAPPPAKKSRTNTPWTPAEEHRLKQMRDAGSSWAEIAKTFPTRTEGSVKKHWYKDMHYAEFAEDESVALLNAIRDYENQKWKVIGQKVGKPAKACEQYAKEHFPEQIAPSMPQASKR